MSVTVIIPTIGRDTLADAVRSAAEADEIVVVYDTATSPDARALPDTDATLIVSHARGGDHGYTARTHAATLASSTHLAYMDDDDVYLPGALDVMREHATTVPVIFRAQHYAFGVIWRDRSLWFGNVSTQMFLVPNEPGKFGVWEPHMPGLAQPGGDFTFITGCVASMGGPVWREDVISQLRPSLVPHT